MPYTHVRLKAFGGPEELEIETVPELPKLGPGEVRVRVLVTSAVFTDVMIRKGQYPNVRQKPPFTSGCDLVGITDALGAIVQDIALGQRVTADDTGTVPSAARKFRPQVLQLGRRLARSVIVLASQPWAQHRQKTTFDAMHPAAPPAETCAAVLRWWFQGSLAASMCRLANP